VTRDDLPEELQHLPQAIDPPPELEERVVGELRLEGLLDRGRGPARPGASWWWMAAACLLAALAGWTARGVVAAPEGPAALVAGNDYLLLLTEPHPLATDKPEAARVAEYRDWATGLASEGKLVSAGKLADGGRYLGSTPAPALGTVSGFFLVRGGSLEDAAALAATCPHRRYGGEIDVRPIEDTEE